MIFEEKKTFFRIRKWPILFEFYPHSKRADIKRRQKIISIYDSVADVPES